MTRDYAKLILLYPYVTHIFQLYFNNLIKHIMKKEKDITEKAKSSEEEILDLLGSLNDAITLKKKNLTSLLKNVTIWLDDRPVSVKEMNESIQSLLKDATDIDLSITKMDRVDMEKNKISVGTTSELSFTNEETWEEHSISVYINVGASKKEGSWQLDFLSIRPVSQQAAPAREDLTIQPQFLYGDYFSVEPPDEGRFQLPPSQEVPYFAQDVISPYFTSAYGQPYFAGPQLLSMEPGSQKEAQEQPQELPGFVPLYVPVFFPDHLVKFLFKK